MLPVNADTYDEPEIDVSPGSMHPAICKLRYGAIDYPPNWFRDKASGLYRKALSIAEEQEAKLWELRASISLARLRRDQGRFAEGRDLLAPIFGWFTEGFDTPDLKEAKALLAELS